MSDAADEERILKMALIRADTANKNADSDYKKGLLRYEPWKVAFTGLAAGAALAGVFIALGGYLHRDPAPPQIIFQPGSIQVLPAPVK